MMITRLASRIINNPALILWIAGLAFAAGLAFGATPAWWIQGLRLDALQGKYETFIARVESLGKEAEAKKEAVELADKLDKEKRDAELQDMLTAAAGLSKQLFDEQRANRSRVPQARGTISDPTRACFRRSELNAAIQRYFDGRRERGDRVWSIVERGDYFRVGLDAAKKRVQDIK